MDWLDIGCRIMAIVNMVMAMVHQYDNNNHKEITSLLWAIILITLSI